MDPNEKTIRVGILTSKTYIYYNIPNNKSKSIIIIVS